LFQPLLYQVASGLIDPSEVAHPVRSVLRHARNADVLMAEVTGVDLENRRVHTSAGDQRYDTLVLATGSATNFFGMSRVEDQSIGLKDLPEALALRAHVLHAFEAASTCPDPARQRRLLTFVVAGAGATGVEYSGALAELIRHVLPHDFPRLDVHQARVILIEGSDRVLGNFAKRLGKDASRRLKRMGVEIMTGRLVKDVEGATVVLDNGQRIEAETIVWTAGVRATPVAAMLGVEPMSLGRVPITRALNVAGHEDVFVIGDAAELTVKGEPLPMLAPVAIQQGRHIAKLIAARLQGKPDPTFRYFDKGTMATVGRGAAVVQLGPVKIDGLIGWLMWVFVHLLYLVGFRSRIIVFVSWAFNYFFYDRPVRLIIGKSADERRITREEA
ncbi:MAG: NAD(P)/FAD-dependent oxidoreductase, partial [Candidatus Dormibacteraeota bacterium]|nr:NAD(P)/FAD-dependent oxidoreductase [Candidatus Dormibacteraeota bacterium]